MCTSPKPGSRRWTHGQLRREHRERTGTLPLIVQFGGHLLKPDGTVLAMKGARPIEEIAALPAGWQVRHVHPLAVPGLEAERHLVVVARA